jgi:hypothetical protein
MSSQFQFLNGEWSQISEAAAKAETLAYPDPRAAYFSVVAPSNLPSTGSIVPMTACSNPTEKI